MDTLIQNQPYGIGDLTDLDTIIKTVYPFSKKDNPTILDDVVLSSMLKLGYVFDYSVMCWYQCDRFSGLYRPVSEDYVKRDITHFLSITAPSGFHIPPKNIQSILERLRADSYQKSCAQKFEDFSIGHDDYYVPPYHDNVDMIGDELIPVLNGVINPATMELLPHCAYLLHHNVYNFNYQKLTEEEILIHPAWDIYAGIIPDKATLELFLWWVGMVLFSPELPRVLMVLYGGAGTGKTTLSLGLSRLLTPSKALQLNLNAFKNSRFLASSFADKQLVVIDEMSNSAGLLDDALFKQLTGGTSNFTIEEKYKQPRNVELRSKFLLIGNSYPAFIQDNAIYDRLFIIPCNIKQNSDIRKVVVADDCLNWLFNAGYLYYVVKHPQKDVNSISELKTPLMLEELGHYCDTDPFNFWIKDYLEIDDISTEIIQQGLNQKSSNAVWQDYRAYVLDNGGSPLSQPKFNAKLRQDYGLEKVQLYDGIKQYKGYRISPERAKGGKK